MARGGKIEIPIAVDTSGVERSLSNGLVDPIEDAEDALKKLEKAGDNVDLDKSLDKAQTATKDLSRELDDARDDLKKLGFAAKDAGDDGRVGMDKIKGGAQELQSEIGSNLGEAVSSFRGDITDLGQVGQDTLGGLAATVAGAGPVGLLGAFALAAGAAGLGLFTAGQEEAKEKQDLLNESAANFASGYIDGINGAMSAAQVFAEINAIATDPARYQEAKDAASEWGVDVRTAMGAMAGDATALATAQEGLDRRTEEANRRLLEQEEQVDGTAGAVYDMADSVTAGAERMDGLTTALAMGKQQADEAAGALYNYATSAGEATDQTDDLGNKIVRLPDGKEIVVDAKTQRAYEDLDALEKKEINDKSATVILNVDDSKVRNYRPPVIQATTVFNPRMGAALY